ncbi:MAG: hypothetical protein ACI9R3_006228, partial [Verrucomicrobiales bacterium]
TTAVLMDDGRIFVAGNFSSVDTVPRRGVVMLFPDGLIDTSFNPDFIMSGEPLSLLEQRDGSVIVGGRFTAQSADTTFHNLIRVLPSGRLDSLFTQDLKTLLSMTDSWHYHDEGQTFGTAWRTADFDDRAWPEGRGLLYVEQATIDGPTNTPITLTRGATTYYFRRSIWNPFEREVVVNLQASFFADDGMVAYINGEEILRQRLPAGIILPETTASPKIINAREEGPYIVPSVTLKPGNNLVAVEVHQEAPTSSDVVFGLRLETPSRPGTNSSLQKGADSTVTAIAPTRDGQLVIGGHFSSITGSVRRSIARLNSDGTVDAGFVSAQHFSEVVGIVVQADQKIVVAGRSDNRPTLTRLLTNGAVDQSFSNSPMAAPIKSLRLATDGTFYLALDKVGINIIHVFQDGTIDDGFLADTANGFVSQLLVSTDGTGITIAGGFSVVDSVQRWGIARLFSEPGESTVRLQTSDNLVDWQHDSAAIIDLSSGTIHATPKQDGTQSIYYRIDGSDEDNAALQPTNSWKNRYFLEILDSR